MTSFARSRSSSSSSEGEFGGLFAEADPEQEVFTFEDWEVFRSTTHIKDALPFQAPVRLPGSPAPCTVVCDTHTTQEEVGERWFAVRFRFRSCTDRVCAAVLWLDGLALPALCDEDRELSHTAESERSLAVTRTLFSIGMCVLCWYYMGFACPTVCVSETLSRRVRLSAEEKDFWRETLNGVLAEFFYVNRARLSFSEVELVWEDATNTDTHTHTHTHNTHNTHTHESHSHKTCEHTTSERVVIPIGGGKDSLVVWHLANSLSSHTSTDSHTNTNHDARKTLLYVSDGFFEFDRNVRLHDLLSLTNCEYLVVRHHFDDVQFNTYKRSYLEPCGHPWAALVLFDSLLVSLCLSRTHTICDVSQHSNLAETCTYSESSLFADVLLGYERSADEGNGVYVGDREVNHQYDKSSAFMRIASDYIRSAITQQVRLRSPLDKMWELDIARIFCQAPALRPFHPIFLSCNEPLNNGTQWCLRCEKCAFISLLLSAWLDARYLEENVFRGRTLMLHAPVTPSSSSSHPEQVPEYTSLRKTDNSHSAPAANLEYYNACRESSVLAVFLSLFGNSGSKPFDCVGTAAEAKAALALTVWRYVRSAIAESEKETGREGGAEELRKEQLPEMLVSLCEHTHLPWFDSAHWVGLSTEDDVLQIYSAESDS